jgi:YYY domain-containing protein
MLLDWILREGWLLPAWWLLVSLAGLAVLPLCWRLLGRLPDKGYTLARTAGLLLVGFVYWLMVSYGFLDNSAGSMIIAWLMVAFVSLFVYFQSGDDDFSLRDYWRRNKSTIIAAEVLFIVFFAGLMVYRAFQHDTSSTEKPMELAFISGIMRSESFPPSDPWLSGYSISYYYFGYLMSAMLSMLSGISSGIGFSMTISLWFGLTALNAFGVVSNLVRSRIERFEETMPDGRSTTPVLWAGTLAAVFVLLLGNFQFALVELPYQSRAASEAYMDFWGVQNRSYDDYGFPNPFADDAREFPEFELTNFNTWTSSTWWWFRASRVLTDYNLDGTVAGHAQPISEFPAFSFVLSDVHPHVLSLPFVLLMMGLALNIVLHSRAPNRYEMLLYGLAVGGLIFLNTWDGPIYLVLLVGAEGLRRLLASDRGRFGWQDWAAMVFFGLLLVGIALLAYLPFFVGFRSQAAGFLPNLAHPTLFRRLFLMFGPLMIIAGAFVLLEIWRGRQYKRMNWKLGLTVSGGVLLILLAFSGFMMLLGVLRPDVADFVARYVQEGGGYGDVIAALIERRIAYGLTTLALLAMLTVIVARLFPRHLTPYDTDTITYPPATGFALLLLGAAVGLVLIPEFIYLRDNFSVRINTVFKFYYQAWLLLSVVSAYGVYSLLSDVRLPRPAAGVRVAFGGVLLLVMGMGLIYSVFGFYGRALYETGYASVNSEPLTLDGTSDMPRTGDDYQAVMCLSERVDGDDAVVLEAERDAYNSAYGRVGSITGIPVVLGWENHERQWRGATFNEIAGNRGADINRLYNEIDWQPVQPLLTEYSIDYIFYGATEIQQYGLAGRDKFDARLPVVCEFGETRVYRVNPDLLSG